MVHRLLYHRKRYQSVTEEPVRLDAAQSAKTRKISFSGPRASLLCDARIARLARYLINFPHHLYASHIDLDYSTCENS